MRVFARSVGFTLLLVVLASGCGSESPPFAVLPLRDTLLAEPNALLALGTEERRSLAERFETARTEAGAVTQVPEREGAEPVAVAREVDRARGAADALIAGRVERGSVTPFTEAPEDRGSLDAPLTIEGPAPGDTEADERRALDGVAGQIVRGLQRRAAAGHVIRVTAWPTAAIAIGDAVYVNAAWLVAMAPEAPRAQPAPATQIPAEVTRVSPTVFTNQGAADAGMTTPPPDAGSASSGGGGGGCNSDCCGSCNSTDCGGCSRCSARDCCRSCNGGRCGVAPAPAPGFTYTRLAALLAPLAFALAFSRRR